MQPVFRKEVYFGKNFNELGLQHMPPEHFKDNVGIMKEFNLPLVTTCIKDFPLLANLRFVPELGTLHRYPAIRENEIELFPFFLTQDKFIPAKAEPFLMGTTIKFDLKPFEH